MGKKRDILNLRKERKTIKGTAQTVAIQQFGLS